MPPTKEGDFTGPAKTDNYSVHEKQRKVLWTKEVKRFLTKEISVEEFKRIKRRLRRAIRGYGQSRLPNHVFELLENDVFEVKLGNIRVFGRFVEKNKKVVLTGAFKKSKRRTTITTTEIEKAKNWREQTFEEFGEVWKDEDPKKRREKR